MVYSCTRTFCRFLSGVALASVGLGMSVDAAAADWPQWQGPQRTGISEETGLLGQWPEGGPPLVWRVDGIGEGYSSPAIVGDWVYVISSEGMENEYVRAMSAEDGATRWTARLGNSGVNRGPNYPGSRSTPTVVGEVLVALGSDGDLACLDARSGEIRWSRNLRADFGGAPGNWAYSESPLVDGDRVIVAPGGETATVVALNLADGREIWRAALPEGDEAAYASPVAASPGGVKQYILFLQHGVVGLAAASGEPLWRYSKTAEGSPANIPTPVVHGDFVYTAASRTGGGLVQIHAGDHGLRAEEKYFMSKLPTGIGGAILLDGHLYGSGGETLMCVEYETGRVVWEERTIAPASLLFADARLYLHGDEEGELGLVEPSPEGLRERGRFVPPNQPDRGNAKAWAYPALANGRLYIRDQGILWCYNVRRTSE